MPQIGDKKYGRDIGKSSQHRFVWCACVECGKERWVRVGEFTAHLSRLFSCRSCASKHNSERLKGKYVGENSSNWKGGKCIVNGYILTILQSNDLFFPMTNHRHYVAEHRLVMAKHLGRCLLSYEHIHHLNGIRTDNRVENLDLMPSIGAHTKMATCSKCEVRKEIRLLAWRIKEQSEQIKELTLQLMDKMVGTSVVVTKTK